MSAGLTLSEITEARLSLGSHGGAVSTVEQLRFQMDHAMARDAVHARLNVERLRGDVVELELSFVELQSAIVGGRGEYLRRPDLGRKLSRPSVVELQAIAASLPQPEVVFVVADGLSAIAVERHAIGVMKSALEKLPGWTVGPVCVVEQGRVAVGDEIGELLGAKLTVLLIGERPGLSAADSLGVYVTWEPRAGRTDAERNCISNIRLGGLSYAEAASRIAYYACEARRLGVTGTALKEDAASMGLPSGCSGEDYQWRVPGGPLKGPRT